MRSIDLLNTHFCENALPAVLPADNLFTQDVVFKAGDTDKMKQKKLNARMADLGYSLNDSGKKYIRSVHDYDLADMVFNSTLPVFEKNEEGKIVESSPKRLCPKGGSTYVIVDEHGYWSRYILGTRKGKQKKNFKRFFHMKYADESALPVYLNQWDGNGPFIVLELDNTPFDFKKVRLTYDIRHVVINHPMQSIVRDLSYLLKPKEERRK